jgi:hypothetical protein
VRRGERLRACGRRGRPVPPPPRPAAGRGHRQCRPTGAPPPLPHPVTITTTAWLVLAAVVLTAAFVASQHGPWLRVEDRASTWLLHQLAGIRTPWLTDVANGIKAAGTGWITILGAAVIILTMIFRRWRHLLVFLGSVLFLDITGTLIYNALSRPRPYGVPIITSWAGYAGASPPVAVLTILLMGVVYCLAVPGRARTYTKAAVVAVFALARLYLGVDHPGDVLLGAAFAVAIAVTAFRFFTPNEVFSVVYRRGRSAHVDVTGRRGEAIRQAMRDQLGFHVTEIKPVGLESSAGPPRSEVFVATRGVASPTQLRAFMKRDPRDLLAEFRALAPQRPPITLQRWSIQRIALAAAVLAATVLAVNLGVQTVTPVGNLGASAPSCGTGHSMILSAQALPSAAMLPCIAALPSGWSTGSADIASGHTRFWLDSDRAGPHAITAP